MFFVRSLSTRLVARLARTCIFVCGCVFVAQVFGYDAPVPFVSGGGLALDGLPGWESSPARRANTAVGVSAFFRSDVSQEWVLSAAGEWGGPSFRGAFLYSYYALDSLFRQSAAFLDAAYSYGSFVGGVGIGAVAQWIPEDAGWVRYRLKTGLALCVGEFAFSAQWSGFLDEFRDRPRVGVLWDASTTFTAYVETGFESVVVGSRLDFAWGSVESSYVFPGFALWFGVSFGFGGYRIGVEHGADGILPAWNGVWVSKNFKK